MGWLYLGNYAVFKLHELTKAHTTVSGSRGLYTTPFLFLMNKAKYESLSDEHKKVIDNNAGLPWQNLLDSFGTVSKFQLGVSIRCWWNHTFSVWSPLAEMKAAGEGLEKDWIKSANDRGLDGAMLVKTAKDLISKYDK